MKKIILLMILFISVLKIQAQKNENIFTYKFGDMEVTLLSEGQQTGNRNILIHAEPKMIKETMPDGVFPNATNAFLVNTPDKIILIDAGLGKQLMKNLESINIHPDQIDIVLLTHLHGDHYGGMLNQGKAVFPNATIYFSGQEYDYWMNEEITKNLPENERGRFLGVRKFIEIYKDKIHLLNPEKIGYIQKPIMPGIHAVEAFGHTPGHTMYLLESGNEKLLIWGDLTHAMAIQMPYPQVVVTYDSNPQEAIISREKVLEYVMTRSIPVAGMHIAYPGMGKIEKNERFGYNFIPLP